MERIQQILNGDQAMPRKQRHTAKRFGNAYPWVLGDNYEELIESLSRLADAGLSMQIASRKDWSGRN